MLLKFTNEGKFVLHVGHRNQSGGNADTRNLDSKGNIYTAEIGRGRRAQKLTFTGLK
jgi:hypothetical protein